MNMMDVIDEIMLDLGAPQSKLDQIKAEITALYLQDEEHKRRATRELSDTEVDRFRHAGRLFVAALLLSPELRERMTKEIQKDITNN